MTRFDSRECLPFARGSGALKLLLPVPERVRRIIEATKTMTGKR